jgi:hypothetical protein
LDGRDWFRPGERGDGALMPDELVEGLDYYMENGFVVFTADYLRKRGFCCRSGCRHCPYGYVPDEPPAIGRPE